MTQQFSPPYEVVEMSRRIFENLISSTLKTSDTTGTCMYGSILVSMLLEKFWLFANYDLSPLVNTPGW
ncbi:hypothetical protein AB6V56_23005 [Klebsiella pneumoniae]